MKIPLIAGRMFDRPGVQHEYEAIISPSNQVCGLWRCSTDGSRAEDGSRRMHLTSVRSVSLPGQHRAGIHRARRLVFTISLLR
jgi:hypothetical protein